MLSHYTELWQNITHRRKAMKYHGMLFFFFFKYTCLEIYTPRIKTKKAPLYEASSHVFRRHNLGPIGKLIILLKEWASDQLLLKVNYVKIRLNIPHHLRTAVHNENFHPYMGPVTKNRKDTYCDSKAAQIGPSCICRDV